MPSPRDDDFDRRRDDDYDRRRDDDNDRRRPDDDYGERPRRRSDDHSDRGDYSRRRSDPDEGRRSRGRDADNGDDQRPSRRRSDYPDDERPRRRDDAGDYSRRRSRDSRERSPRRDYRDDGGRGRGGSRYDDDRRRSSYDDADDRDAGRRRRRESTTKWETSQDDKPPTQTLANEKLPDWLADLGEGSAPSSSSGGQDGPAGMLVSGGVAVQPSRLNCKTIQIPTHLRGSIIGTGGSVINKIRAETQSYIQVNTCAPDAPFVSVMITGNVEKVEEMINKKIREVEVDEAWRKKPKKDEWKTQPKNSWLMQQLQAEGCSTDRASFLLQSAATTAPPVPTVPMGLAMAPNNNNWSAQWQGQWP